MSFKAVFITFAVIAIAALGGAGAFFWYQGSVARGLTIRLEVPDEVSSGVPFTLDVGVSNDSRSVLQEVELMVELPEDVVFVGSDPGKTATTKAIGNLGSGGLIQESFRIMALGGEESIKEILVTVGYLPTALGSRFERGESASFAIVGPGLRLDFSAPEEVFSGETFDVLLTYKNVSEIDLDDLVLKFDFPPAMTFVSASPKPDFGNNLWELGGLRSGSEGKIELKAKLLGPDKSFYELISSVEAGFLGRSYEIVKRSATVAIAASPLSLEITLNGNPSFVAHPEDMLNYRLVFTNNTDIGLRDVIVRAKLKGELFDLTSLSGGAYLRSTDSTLVWNASNAPVLSVIPPGGSGAVNFSLRVKPQYPIARLSDKNFTLRVDGEIESPTVPASISSDKTLGIAEIETKVGGETRIDSRGFFRDAASGILNKGPWPPKVGQPTNFTIHWVVTNFSTDVRDVKINAFLGGNVRITGTPKSNASSVPTWNDRTQGVEWMIDRIPAARGVLNAPLEAIFQVEVTPSITDLGHGARLIQETFLETTDEFTGETLKSSDGTISSDSLDDPTVTKQEGEVIQ